MVRYPICTYRPNPSRTFNLFGTHIGVQCVIEINQKTVESINNKQIVYTYIAMQNASSFKQFTMTYNKN